MNAVAGGPVRILRIATGGDGVAKLEDGRTVFVPRTAPGDLVRLRELRLAKTFARAAVADIVEASPDRVEPACPHYEREQCGGCQLQHCSMPLQLDAKRAMVGEALRRIAKLDVPDPEIEAADTAWGYRHKVTLAVGTGGRPIGFHRQGQAGNLFELTRCLIAEPSLMDLWTLVRAHRAHLPPDAEQLVLRLDRQGVRHLVVRIRGQTAWGGAAALHRELVARGVPAVVWWEPEGGAPRAMAGAPEPWPVAAFEQINPRMGDRIRAWAVSHLGSLEGLKAWDLYAGIGETTALLTGAGARVESVELDARAVREGARRGPEAGVVRHVGRAEDVAPRLSAPDVVITNPPRTGMDGRVTDAIVAARPRRVAYVSCDPATLARDLSRLLSRVPASPPLRLAQLRAFDLFPQTAHVETVAILEAEG
jgi:23S rRNA (uracil1939-C5)-methyltransferase